MYVVGFIQFHLLFKALSSVKTRWVLSQSPPRKQYIVISGISVGGGGQDVHISFDRCKGGVTIYYSAKQCSTSKEDRAREGESERREREREGR